MPQMFRYCGQRYRVFRRAGKTCSEKCGPKGVVYVSRRLADTVHLEHRCDGTSHGGCQAGCLIFWKEAWLKGATPASSPSPAGDVPARARAPGCSAETVLAATTRRTPAGETR